MKILMSALALKGLAPSVAKVMTGRSYECFTFEDAIASGRRDFDVAFVSRDVTGTSTKHEIAPELQARYTVLEETTSLRWVHIHSSGADRDVYVRLKAKGVHVATSPGANAEVVAQSALAGLLALSRKFPQLVHAMREHRWAPLLGSDLPSDLNGQHVVLVGWGPIAQRFAQFLKMLSLNVTVVRHSLQASSAPKTDEPHMISYAELPGVLPSAHWLVLMCPLTNITRGLVNANNLALMPNGAGLVNVSRGEVVVEKDLIHALQDGTLGSAFLDVFEHEPLPKNSPLWDLPNVMLTPHSAGFSSGNEARVSQMFLRNLGEWAQQEERT